MLQYTNSFYCSYSSEEKKVVIHFKQAEPLPSDNDGPQENSVVMNDIVSLIMDEDFFQKLLDSIQGLRKDANALPAKDDIKSKD